MLATMAGMCGAMCGACAMMVASRLTTPQPCARQQRRDRAQQLAAVDALVVRIGVRKMAADVAQRRRRRSAHRRSRAAARRRRNARQARCRMRNGHAADDELAARDQRVHVEALSDSHASSMLFKYQLRQRQVLRIRDLEVARVAHAPAAASGRAVRSRWPRRSPPPGRRRAALRAARGSGTSAASAPATRPRAARWLHDAAVGVGALERIGHRQRQQQPAGGVVAHVDDQPRRVSAARQAGPRRVVHQHPVVGVDQVARRQQAVEHACGARRRRRSTAARACPRNGCQSNCPRNRCRPAPARRTRARSRRSAASRCSAW